MGISYNFWKTWEGYLEIFSIRDDYPSPEHFYTEWIIPGTIQED